MERRAIIIGAGPAGLTAALEFLRRSNVTPIVLEASHEIGGLSRTVRYNGNRMDIGGHRFFSKSDRVMQWWLDLMPLEADSSSAHTVSYRGRQRVVAVPARLAEEPVLRGAGPLITEAVEADVASCDESGHGEAVMTVAAPADPDLVMLIRPRKSRIYYLRRFFDYPITLTGTTLRNLGAVRTIKVGTSYIFSRVNQIKPEKSLRDFLINRFGRQLYFTFFKSYTEKVWGTPCEEISAEWGAQRIKGLNLTTAVKHFAKKTFGQKKSEDIAQKGTDTSLIERFLYPKLGPGQLWEHVADLVRERGGEIHMGWRVGGIHCEGSRVVSVDAINDAGERRTFAGDYFFSTMPMRELVQAIDAPVPENVREVSEGLQYRDFITVGLLVERLKVRETDGGLLKDTWIYIQEPDVLLGRLQIFNNWSPYLVADPDKVWIGLEYFCYDTDDLWKMPDEELKQFAIAEVAKIGILNAEDVTDGHVVRVPKTYPAYFGTYNRFDELRSFTDGFENLFLVGRNGMHKYNNQDHSMLTAMMAVDGIISGNLDKAALWEINTEQEHHEERAPDEQYQEAIVP
ncbi:MULTISPECIES: NAD(P)/FAD-dependent oxidoreductase [Acidobacteriaceae]|uniref:NAD(P)/FAD-dependent oxidoreductase n=1 Tax=Acidobacteriaceae TaxID=204434 RepID=UPI00131C08D8|nr:MULTISPECIES: NAD(P)/FAD-dependent oxidoreductase [Acidobacteriaceae]MDW5265800.1 NAD(P)/FAD-dependent oxidoreductase [Edaphobacter sp.]